MGLNNTDIYNKNIEKNQEALEYFNQALEIQRNMYGNDYNLDIANTLIYICSIYLNIGINDKALEYYSQATKIYENIFGFNILNMLIPICFLFLLILEFIKQHLIAINNVFMFCNNFFILTFSLI